MSVVKTVKYYSKSVLFATLIAGCALYGVMASVFLTAIGRRDLAQWTVARAFYGSVSTLMNIKINVINEERLSGLPAILVGNHQSALDILILGKVFPKNCFVTSKKSLKYVPLLGWFMSLSGTFFLDRSRKEKAKAVLNKALKDLKKSKKGLYIFPEGTRSATEQLELLDFKKGAFHLAVQAQIPIIPIVVSNTSNIFSSKTKTFNSGVITIEVLEPVSTEGLTAEDVTQLAATTQDKMLTTLKKIGYSKTSDGLQPTVVEPETDEDAGETTTLLSST